MEIIFTALPPQRRDGAARGGGGGNVLCTDSHQLTNLAIKLTTGRWNF